MDIKTDFLAEEWFDLLKTKVEPVFTGTEFYTYTPPPGKGLRRFARNSPKIGVIVDDKEVFKNRLKGYPVVVDKLSVEASLQRHVWSTFKKVMNTQ